MYVIVLRLLLKVRLYIVSGHPLLPGSKQSVCLFGVSVASPSLVVAGVKYDAYAAQQTHLFAEVVRTELESQVTRLGDVICGMQARLGYPFSEILQKPLASASPSAQDDELDDSSVSEGLTAAEPMHLQSLFDNELIRPSPRTRGSPDKGHDITKTNPPLLDAARKALQALIPPRNEARSMIEAGSTWLALIHSMLPPGLTSRSKDDMLACYDAMQKPDIETFELGTWLLDSVICAQHFPKSECSAEEHQQ
ncbi:hypothetical protein LTR70_009716 [Exophiala xenobiotica]|uniref:Uncharacterized protein n=1 Tax=Lithohypha guttulata TaxID=1690604 RepID=A0ABR0JY99_9EURO|nr:hypothetical protein LTR24_009638 [Lithohypha guttulata]KAK5310126.1 hypothetical protein LTR70_009716 [Exophiala xenobiotica]